MAEYIDAYEALGAERVNAIATSAVRDAANSGAFIAELRERFGLDARILAGAEEAGLVYLGAFAERPPASESTLVVDIGGGSTELVVGSGAEVGFYTSLQAGTVRHTERYLRTDPPDPGELEALSDDVRSLIDAELTGEAIATAARGSRSPAHRPRWLRSTRSSTPMTPSAFTATSSLSTRSSACTRCSPRRPSRSASGHRPASGSGADDRRRRRDPDPGDAGLRPQGDRGLRARHPLRRRARGRPRPGLSAQYLPEIRSQARRSLS